MKKNAPQPIGDVLKNVVEELSRSKAGDIGKICSGWPAIAGKELSRHTRPLSLKKGTLKVAVDSSAWFYQASLQQEKMLAALRKKIGGKKIQTIQFRIGKI